MEAVGASGTSIEWEVQPRIPVCAFPVEVKVKECGIREIRGGHEDSLHEE